MAEKRRFLDVWIVETNTVYRDVPFTVVSDWVQQGRLLADDMLKPSGTNQWALLGSTAEFSAYLPKVEPHRAEDQAEALEPVQMEMAWKHRAGDEDEDVDMIPLIDISLVLLIFFMMTSTVALATSSIDLAQAENANIIADPQMLWLAIDRGASGQLVCAIGRGDEAAAKQDQQLSEADAVRRLDAMIAEIQAPVNLRISAQRTLASGEVMRIAEQVQRLQNKYRQRLQNIYNEVKEKNP